MKGWQRVIDFIFFFARRNDGLVPRSIDDTSEAFERVRREHADIERRIQALELKADVMASRGKR